MKKNSYYWVILALLGILGLFLSVKTSFNIKDSKPAPIAKEMESPTQISTEQYIANFDPKSYELAGSDYFNDRYSLLHLNKPIEKIDITYDFDFALLKKVSDRLAKVNRHKALMAIFDKLTINAKSDTEKHLAVLGFLQRSGFNALLQPMYEDKQAVFDPLILLELGTIRCGAIARIGADLFDSAGYRARIISVAGHTTAEIFYENDWHLFEADMHGGGQTIMLDGKVPSLAKLSKQPYLIDRIPTHLEYYASVQQDLNKLVNENTKSASPANKAQTEVKAGAPSNPGKTKTIAKKVEPTTKISQPLTPFYPSYYFFSKEGQRATNTKLYVYYKTATKEQAEESKWYGWNYYRTEQDKSIGISNILPKSEPTPPHFSEITINRNIATIKWSPSFDHDNDLLGYRVFVSKISRGWQHQYFTGSDQAKKYWHGGWKPSMYDAMFRLPPSDVKLITTSKKSVTIKLPAGETRYVTIMPYDKHGESVGRKLYDMSEELALTY